MKCVFLGTGYSITSARRHNTSLFLQKGSTGLLIDCNGLCVPRLGAAGFAFEDLEHVFLTHEHIDHIGALANLMQQIWLKSSYYRPENRRTAPINFYGNERTLKMVQAVFAALGLPRSPHIFAFNFHTLPDSGGKLAVGDIALTYFPVRHAATPCFGITSRSGSRGLVYSADTEPLPLLYSQLQAGDILIHECNSIDAPLNTGHTTWQQLQDMLPSLPAVELYLVHLPHVSDERESAFKAFLKQTYKGHVAMAEDGLALSV